MIKISGDVKLLKSKIKAGEDFQIELSGFSELKLRGLNLNFGCENALELSADFYGHGECKYISIRQDGVNIVVIHLADNNTVNFSNASINGFPFDFKCIRLWTSYSADKDDGEYVYLTGNILPEDVTVKLVSGSKNDIWVTFLVDSEIMGEIITKLKRVIKKSKRTTKQEDI